MRPSSTPRDISSGKRGDGVQRPVRAFNPNAILDHAAQYFCFGIGAGCIHVPAQKTRFASGVATEANKVGAIAFSGGDQAIRVRRIVWHDRRATRFEAGINIALLVGDGFE